MNISITKEHIENGIARDSHHCMIADALKEAIPEAQYILVDLQSIRYSLPASKKRYVHLTPLKAQRALIKFDQGRSVKPFEFTLPAVFSERDMGWEGQRSPGAKRRKHKKTGKKRLIVAYRERAYGLRNIPA